MLLTPPGRSALAALAVTGPGAFDLATRLFTTRSGKAVPCEPGRFHLGTICGDDAILAVHGPERVEIHCHGGEQVARLIIEEFARHGARETTVRESASLAERMLPFALTVRTASILLDQLNSPVGDPARYADIGRHLTAPWRVAVLGPPNAGKSSLVNALAGYQRSIVAATPGTTRDVVGVLIALDGWPVELLDTAGVRMGEGLEAAGIAEGLATATECDLCLWVTDATAEPVAPPRGLDRVLPVVNKSDLAPEGEGLRVSALTGAGLDTMAAVIAAALVPEPPPPGASVALPEESWRAFR